MKEEAALRNAYGDNVDYLGKSEVQERVNSPRYVGALFDHDGTALVDPARLVWGLERVCLSLGVKIFENSKVDWLQDDADEVIVHSSYGKVRAKKVALATNVFPSLIRSARKYVIPVYDYQLVTEPLTKEQRESIGWQNREGISDAGNQFHYYRLTNDGEILWGGFEAIYNFRGKVRQEYEFSPDTYATLADNFLKTFPQLEGISFTQWVGWSDRHLFSLLAFLGTLSQRKSGICTWLHGFGCRGNTLWRCHTFGFTRWQRHRTNSIENGSKETDSISTRTFSFYFHPHYPMVDQSRRFSSR